LAEVTLPRTRMFDLRRPDGEMQRIFVAWPAVPPPATGSPVIYLLDGNADFAVMVHAARSHAQRPELSHVEPAVIVGIGYPIDDDLDLQRRTFDYTPAAPRERLGLRPNGKPWPATGGADAFLAFIEQHVKPRIAADFAIDPARQALFGHSFGGLFTLYTAFTMPQLFQGFYASSPSIWFAGRFVLEFERDFGARLAALGSRRDLMISIGALEQMLPADRIATTGPRYMEWVRGNRMVDNARELAARLAALEAVGLDLAFHEFADESHISATPLAISRTVRRALRPLPRSAAAQMPASAG